MNAPKSETYDPAEDANAHLYPMPGVELYVSNPHEVVTNIYQGGSTPREYSLGSFSHKGAVATSKLVITQESAGADDWRWLYEGSAKLRSPEDFSAGNFLGIFDEMISEVTDVESEQLYFTNARLIVSKASGALAVLSVYEKDGTISYTNHRSMSSSRKERKALSIALQAPMLRGELDMRPQDQLVDHLRHHIVAVNALSRSVGEHAAITKFALTPSSTYSWGKSGQKLHDGSKTGSSVARGAAEVSPAAKPEASQPVLLEDIAGNDELKAELKRVAVSFKHPEVLARWGAERPQGILLYGPAGTGKSTIAKALANEIGGDLWEIGSADIYDRYLGESEKNLQAIFDKAKDLSKPTVMVWNEFDALVRGGDGEGDNHVVQRVAGIFKNGMEKIRQNAQVIIMASTNHYDALDPALIRDGRFDIKRYVPLPDAATRSALFVNNIASMSTRLGTEDFSPFADNLDPAELAAVATDMSGAAITNVFQRVAFEKAMQDASGSAPEPISQADLLAAIRALRQS